MDSRGSLKVIKLILLGVFPSSDLCHVIKLAKKGYNILTSLFFPFYLCRMVQFFLSGSALTVKPSTTQSP